MKDPSDYEMILTMDEIKTHKIEAWKAWVKQKSTLTTLIPKLVQKVESTKN